MAKVKKLILENFLVGLLLFPLILFVYGKIFSIYFQQDEWYGFGQAIFAKSVNFSNLFRVLGTYHFTPLASLFFFVEYYLWGLNSIGYAWVAIVAHALATVLFYNLAKLIFNNKILAILGAAFFALNSSLYQGVTWFATNIPTEFATIFAFLTLIFWFRKRRPSVALSLALLFFGLLFKEEIITLVLTIPIISYFLSREKQDGPYFKYIFSFGFFYFVLRVFLQHFLKDTASQESLNITGIFSPLFGNLKIALGSVGYGLVSPDMLLRFFRFISAEIYYIDQLYLETKLIPVAVILISALILLFLFILIRKGKLDKRNFFLPFSIFLSILPYAFLGRKLVIPESRYFYFSGIFISLFFIQIVKLATNVFREKRIVVLVIFLLFISHILTTKSQLSWLSKISEERRFIVSELQKVVVPEQKKVIYLFQGDTPFFQSGMGQMLLVISAEKNLRLSPFFDGYFLWNLNSQGYKEIDGYGFGFFTDKQKLTLALREHKITSVPAVILTWNEKNKKLTKTIVPARKFLD